MQLKDYDECAEPPLAFPIRGKLYTPPPISISTGVALIRALAGDTELLSMESRSLWQMLLGPIYDEMVADDVPIDAVNRAGFAVLVEFQAGRDAAVKAWESGIDPEARAALAAALRVTDSTPSTGTGLARKTRSRASTSSTTSRPAAARTQAKRSSGKRS